jgi:hypothetical protein
MSAQKLPIVVVLSTLLVALLFVWSLPGAGAAVRQSAVTTKGFVTARNRTTLTLLAGNRRLVVAVTSDTRILGQRDSFESIVPNDVVRAEGRLVGNRLTAVSVEVVQTADGLRVRPQPDEVRIDFLTIDMTPR